MFAQPIRSWYDATTSKLRKRFWAVNWVRGAPVLLFLWVITLAWIAVVVATHVGNTFKGGPHTACMPDNTFKTDPGMYNYWHISGFFQITFGPSNSNLSFEQAKIIDVTWDVVVGRGGQALIAWLSYKVIARYITAVMTQGSVTYRSFLIVFIQTSPSILSIFRLARDFTTRQAIRSQIAMIFIISTMIFTLAFPTLASAMTGYTSGVQAYIQLEDGNYIPAGNFTRTRTYTIHDGDRVSGQLVSGEYNQNGSDYVVRENGTLQADIAQCASVFAYSENDLFYVLDIYKPLKKYIDHETYRKKEEHSISASQFRWQPLGPPVLDISFSEIWWFAGERYDLAYIAKSGSCQNIETYKWGFSFTQLFMNTLFLLSWSSGLMILWYRANRTQGVTICVPGDYKALLQGGLTLKRDLGIRRRDVNKSTEKELEISIDDLQGGRISFQRRGCRNNVV